MQKTCEKGHHYFKSSDCPTCPICEAERKPQNGFLALLGAPARRALEREGIITLEELSNYSEKDLLRLHGFGKSSLPILKKALSESDLNFREI